MVHKLGDSFDVLPPTSTRRVFFSCDASGKGTWGLNRNSSYYLIAQLTVEINVVLAL